MYYDRAVTLDPATARHALPHPLAVLHNRLRHPDPVDRLRETFAFCEGVTRFLAWILVAEAAAHRADAKSLRTCCLLYTSPSPRD